MLPIAKSLGGSIALVDPSNQVVLCKLSPAEAVELGLNLQKLAQASFAEQLERADAYMRVVSDYLAMVMPCARAKQPWELTRSQWQAVHRPVQWVRGLSHDGMPPFLRDMTLMPQTMAQLVIRVDSIFTRRLGFPPNGARSATGICEPRHELHVACALSRNVRVPAKVLADYPKSFWMQPGLDWVLRHLDRQAWATRILGRKVKEGETAALDRLATTRYDAVARSGHWLDAGQVFDGMKPQSVERELQQFLARKAA